MTSQTEEYIPLRRKISTSRYGSSPKLICYTQSNSARLFNYQRPPNEVKQELTGKSLRHVKPMPSKDVVQFRIVNINKLPNSKRTVVPELAPEPQKVKVRSKSISTIFSNPYDTISNPRDNNNPNSYNTYSITNNNTIPIRDEIFGTKPRRTNPKVYRSFSFEKIYNPNTNENNNDNYNEYAYRPSTRPAQFSSYNKTTQIVNLPGGVKRNINDINDDGDIKNMRSLQKWDKPSHNTKIYKDYKSNVACLPGTGTITVLDKPVTKRAINQRRYDSNDIFNTRYNSNNNNDYTGKTFKQYSGKRINMSKRSNNESNNDIYQNRFQGIKKNYKNYSQIQLC